jgi:hypothetical protein
MSATSSSPSPRRALARLFVRVVFPLISLVLGVVFFMFGVFSWLAPLLLRAEMLVGGGAAATTGFLALYWGIRAHFNADAAVRAVAAVRSDMAVGGVFMVLGLAGVCGATGDLQNDYGPLQTRDVRIDRVAPVAFRDITGANLYLQDEKGFLPWRCKSDCSARPAILQLRPGAPAKLAMIGRHLIGLEADGQALLDVDTERQRLKGSDALGWALFAAMASGAAIYVPWRGRALRNPPPRDPRPAIETVEPASQLQRAWTYQGGDGA